MNLRSDKRQNIQGELDFSSSPAGEACEAKREETESLSVVHDPESPASTNRWMEEICKRENLKQALQQVKANKGSAGVDGMTVGGITDYLKQHWPAIREQLLNGTYEPKPVRRGEIPKLDGGGRNRGLAEAAVPSHPGTTVDRDLRAETGEAGGNPQAGRRGAKAWHPNGAGSVDPAGGDAGSAEAVGPDVFRLQLRVPAGTVGSSGGGTGAAVYRRRPRLVR